MNVAVIHGGYSPESMASTENAKEITKALRQAGHNAEMIEFRDDIMSQLTAHDYDKAFVATQGKYHGDGTCQAICDQISLPYTGTRAAAAAVINNKVLCKKLCCYHGISTPDFIELEYQDIIGLRQTSLHCKIMKKLTYPAVVKASTQGGSFGIEYLSSFEEIDKIKNVFLYDDDVFIEKYISGIFVTASLLEHQGELISLPLLTASTISDNPLKLFTGDFQIHSPALSETLEHKLKEAAVNIFTFCKAKGYARVDFMVDVEKEIPYFLEINAIPGLREKSFFPLAAKMHGYELSQLCDIIIQQRNI